jgi:hypothetical protein
MAAAAGPDGETAPAVPGQGSTKAKNMSFYLSQRCWGRSCLHLAAALRASHWRWHFAGIGREIHFTRSLTLNGHTTAGGCL